jgi:hypothetical protein
LDKEMTILGILSTFSVAVVALALDRVGSADLGENAPFWRVWRNQPQYVMLGSACMAMEAAFFSVAFHACMVLRPDQPEFRMPCH